MCEVRANGKNDGKAIANDDRLYDNESIPYIYLNSTLTHIYIYIFIQNIAFSSEKL